jgi:hypothetical protein
MRSVRVVFPESICADTPMLRWYFNRCLSASVSWNRSASEGAAVSVATCGRAFTAADAVEAWRHGTEKGGVTLLRKGEKAKSCSRDERSGSIGRDDLQISANTHC